ncbi:hypothetical protein BC828DRAFT_344506 [Blastocladiella britannica]|nr:hypothetical protein BC828DRAFT_344506 [Blastocladiella britannica]
MHPEKVVLLHGAVIDVEDHYPRLTKPYVLLSITLPSSTGTTRQRTTYRIKPDNPRDQAVLVHALKVAARHPYIGSHPHGSFAPPQPAHVEYFVDGQDYFERVAEGISNARHTIYILDWWLTPELYLKRPMNEGAEKWRLDRLLQRKAEEGVYIYIIVYKEIAAALSLNSFHTKFTLMGLHPNIRVIRDPDALDHLIPWSHHAKMVCIDEVVTFMGGLDLCMGRWDRHDHPLVDVAPLNTGEQVFPGQDYSNPRIADFVNVDTTWAIDILDRRKQPRMPWHDVACVVVGNPDSARHFVQRWNYHLTVNRPAHLQLPMLIPPCGPSRHSLHHLSAVSGMSLDAFYSGHHLVATQLCRSLSPWSGGVPIERSIHDAYVDLIRESRHNIYIEQQFFCCVVNNVGDALFDRVMRAHCEGQHDFRIVVCLPLLPAFTGEVDASGAGTLRMVMNFQYTTISRGPDSLYGRLNKAGVDATKYMIFSALRTWDKVPAVGTSADAAAATSAPVPPITPSPPVSVGTSVVASSTTTARQQAKVLTEMVYIHTKCMVVDDERAILGSANLNDRSLLGDRDSELAHVFGTSGVPSPVVRGLRMQLMREHCGLLGADHDHAPKVAALADLSSPEFLDLWTSTAATNTRAFRDVFRCIPDDSITTWDEYKAFVGSAPMAAGALSVADATRRLETDVRGHLVEFPLKFLEKENLGANTFSAENFMPADIFA